MFRSTKQLDKCETITINIVVILLNRKLHKVPRCILDPTRNFNEHVKQKCRTTM